MKSFWLVPLFLYMAGIAYLCGRFAEPHAGLTFVGILVAHSIVMSLVANRAERRLYEDLGGANPRALREAEADLPELAAFMRDRPRVNEVRDWSWRLSDYALAITSFFAGPVIYTLVRYRAISGTTPFDGADVLLMVAGLGLYLYCRPRRIVAYRCHRCGGPTIRLASSSIRRSCAKCGVTWFLGE